MELGERWPKTRDIPRVELCKLPTPIELLKNVSEQCGIEVYAKRDDLTSNRYGGNKARKLEFLLGEARQKGANTLITTGAVGSNHVLATSVHGRDHGFEVHAALVPQRSTPHVEANARADVAVGAHLHAVPRGLSQSAAIHGLSGALRLRGKRPYVIPVGGSSATGTLGYVAAGIELAGQMTRGEIPDIERIFMPLGTCATLAGTALGLAACGVTTRVVGVRVTPTAFANMSIVEDLMRDAARRLRAYDDRFPDIESEALARITIDAGQFEPGYGEQNDAADRAKTIAGSDGLTLETTYSARALAGLLSTVSTTKKPTLFWMTLNGTDISSLGGATVSLPPEIARLIR